jgi:hypothetical protein
MPPGAIYVGRPTDYGNRYIVGEVIEHVDNRQHLVTNAAHAKRLFAEWIEWQFGHFPSWRESIKRELGGHDLACWCALDQPCHADVLLELANAPRREAA